ncbi:MAG: thiamine-phosphate kinase [Candidatus Rokubacteria bacterium]|nr:thiamine-phosphate kinase [Candidatus Rokubacteria bacterium]
MSAGRLTERALIGIARRRAGDVLPGVRVGIGDDCAVLEPRAGAPLLATTDLLVEDVHFRRRWTSPADLGWKSLAVNLSDIAAMGGRPRWALVALACPAETSLEEVEAFFGGALALASAHDVVLVGGDTSASPSGWIVNVTLLGEAATAPLLRSTARVGDVLAVTGPLGRSAAGLTLLELPAPPPAVPADASTDVRAAHLRPRPRLREGQWLAAAGGVTAMIDLSDGLAADVAHIAEESRVGARVDLPRLPVDESTRCVARALDRDPLAWATGGGEDYELLLACDSHALDRLTAGLALATGAVLSPIGEIVERKEGVRFVGAGGRDVQVAPGFEHFVASR